QPLHVRRPDGLDGDRLRSLAQHGMSEARHLQDRHDAQNCSMWSQHPGRGHVTPAYPKESTMSMTPEGLDPSIRTREIVFDADVRSVTPFLKLATVSRGGGGHMTFACDEGPALGGLGSAPTPLMYFGAALAFCLMTQVARYGHMLKVAIDGMRMKVRGSYRVDGSVLNDTIEAQMVSAEIDVELESTDAPDRVARVLRTAERGCFVMQALLRPVPVTTHARLNGAPLTA